ncbi:MAG: hypothetical protein JO102_01030, partial [Elusimicrobia bacterium]|nr:hypothetical protein [Elusimicrobiota bacterium]
MIDPTAVSAPLRLQLDNFTDNLWGGDWIPRMKGIPIPDAPVGESWEFSAHPNRPSLVTVGSRVIPLSELLADAPKAVFGERLNARLSGRAPFLLKFIDSRDDLSVQVHPSDEQARAHGADAGKPESWLILDTGEAEGEGFIYVGFNPLKS